MKVSPGDSITASVTYQTSGTYAGDYLLSINDTSHSNDSFSIIREPLAVPGSPARSEQCRVDHGNPGREWRLGHAAELRQHYLHQLQRSDQRNGLTLFVQLQA